MATLSIAWSIGDDVVRWTHGSTVIEKRYEGEIGSAVALQDSSGVAVVEPANHGGLNAVVFNADGTERFRVEPPVLVRHVAFQQMYYVRDELTAIAITRGNDWAAVVDESTGDQIRAYETR